MYTFLASKPLPVSGNRPPAAVGVDARTEASLVARVPLDVAGTALASAGALGRLSSCAAPPTAAVVPAADDDNVGAFSPPETGAAVPPMLATVEPHPARRQAAPTIGGAHLGRFFTITNRGLARQAAIAESYRESIDWSIKISVGRS